MRATVDFLAIDLGASSGRLVAGCWDGTRFSLQEVHRFANAGVAAPGGLYWDVLRMWAEIGVGLEKYAAERGRAPASISVDTWGVDFALLDRHGRLVGNPHHYRDPRTNGAPDRAYARIPRADVFRQTGIQSLSINTIFQLFVMAEAGDARLDAARALVMMPDLFHYWMSGEPAIEYTIASTTQMLRCRERTWAGDILQSLGIPTRLLSPPVLPGTVLADLRADLARQSGFASRCPVVAGASHDTASAVAAIPHLDHDSVYVSSGTWSLMGIETREPVTSDQALAFGFTNEGGVGGTIRLLKNITGLWLLQECVRQWGRDGREPGWDEIVRLASAATPLRSLVDPDADVFRAPENMPDALRAFCRDSGQVEPASVGEMARCCLESVALKCRLVLDALCTLTGRALSTVRLVGGGSRNTLLCQLTADACARPVVAGPVEASALGNVMVQAVATGHLDSIAAGRERIAASCDLVTFEPRRSEAWESARERFRALVRS